MIYNSEIEYHCKEALTLFSNILTELPISIGSHVFNRHAKSGKLSKWNVITVEKWKMYKGQLVQI